MGCPVLRLRMLLQAPKPARIWEGGQHGRRLGDRAVSLLCAYAYSHTDARPSCWLCAYAYSQTDSKDC
eukprot:1089174-Rhodomonas_salina.3